MPQHFGLFQFHPGSHAAVAHEESAIERYRSFLTGCARFQNRGLRVGVRAPSMMTWNRPDLLLVSCLQFDCASFNLTFSIDSGPPLSQLGFAMFWILIPLLIVGLSALLGWAIVYIRFCRTREKKWSNGVLSLATEARRRVQKEKDRIRDLDASRENEKNGLQGKEFSAYLGSISTSELELFSGIGPATVARLHEAGYANLASLQHSDIHVHGLGEKRLHDIARAVQELTKQAWGRFEAGGCPEAQPLKPKFDALRSKYDNLKFVTQARLKGAEAVVEKLEQLLPIVRQVTFFNYWRKTWSNIVPADILEAPLPDLEGTIHKAEEIAISVHRLNELLSTGEQSSVFQLAERIIQDSGSLSDGTNDFLGTVAKKLGVPLTNKPINNETKPTPARSEIVLNSRQEDENQLSTDKCRGLLEIAPTIPLSPDLVRRQYLLLYERYNPEKVVSLGPEFVEMTERKRHDISIAANALIEQFGERRSCWLMKLLRRTEENRENRESSYLCFLCCLLCYHGTIRV